MANINDKDFRQYSMPLHNPYYEQMPVCFSADIFSVYYEVENPGVINEIVPHPLVYADNGVKITLNSVKELKRGFPEDCTLWNELSVQIPVMYNDQPSDYICEVYSSDLKTIVYDRELYGLPRVPGHISVEKSDRGVKAKLMEFSDKREMLGFTFEFLTENLPKQGPLPKQKKIILKYIPSADLSNPPDVKKLMAMKYGKPLIQKSKAGKGGIEFFDSAPKYLKEAGIVRVIESFYMDMELDILGGEVLHNYI